MAVDTRSRASGVFSEENTERRDQLIEMLKKAQTSLQERVPART